MRKYTTSVYRKLAKAVSLFFFITLIFPAATLAQGDKDIARSLQKARYISKVISGELEAPAEDYDLSDISIGNMGKYSYILAEGYMNVVSGAPVYYKDLAMFPPGERNIRVQFYRRYETHTDPRMSAGRSVSRVAVNIEMSEVIPMTVTLEPGKIYSLEAKIGLESLLTQGIGISLTEVTDTRKAERALAKVEEIISNPDDFKANIVTAAFHKDYMDWSTSHYGTFDGSYSNADGKVQIKFAGDKFQIYHTRTLSPESHFLYGSYWMNDRTLIMHTDSIKITTLSGMRNRPAKEIIKTETLSEILYYKINDDSFEIIARNGSTEYELEGRFFKRHGPDTGATSREDSGSVSSAAEGMASPDIAWRLEGTTLMVTGRGDIPGDPSWSRVIDRFTSAVIGDGITSLGHHSFAMSPIESVVIGKDAQLLNNYAFFNCKQLTRVEVKNPVPPKIASFVFMGTPVGKATLVVPAGSKAAYEKNKSWKKFGSIEEF